jgi:hypothetical protein
VNQTLQLIYRGSRDYSIASGRNDFCSRHFPYAGENSTSLASANEIFTKGTAPALSMAGAVRSARSLFARAVCLDQLGELAGPAAVR